MKHWITAGLAGLVFVAASAPLRAQVAGSTTLGVAVEQTERITLGWSARKQFLGRPVYNEVGQKVGAVDDLIITPDDAVSVAIVGVGGIVSGEPRFDEIECKLASAPVITVPTITMEGDANGAPHSEPASYAGKFAGRYCIATCVAASGTTCRRRPPQNSRRLFWTSRSCDHRSCERIRHEDHAQMRTASESTPTPPLPSPPSLRRAPCRGRRRRPATAPARPRAAAC